MESNIKERMATLQAEYAKGEQELKQMAQRAQEIQTMLLRIEGAYAELNAMLPKEESEDEPVQVEAELV